MSIYIFYFLAAIPFIIGGILWIYNKEVNWIEWIGNSILCFIVAGVFHAIAICSQTRDIETWSGQITHAIFYPTWIEEYQQMHTRTVGSGDNEHTEIYYTTEHCTHNEYWEAYSNINTSYRISRKFYDEIKNNFVGYKIEKPYKPGFDSGDPNIYTTFNQAGYIYPITSTRNWSNRIKAAPSAFSFAKVPDTIKIFEYPKNDDAWHSDRLLGSAVIIDLLKFDRMNARLGPHKKVNIIMIGFGDKDQSIADWQQAKWIGGKKNDIVICWGGLNTKPIWVKVFGWSDSEICKRNLETIVLDNGATNDTLSLIESEITTGYKLKDWSKFDYITIEAPSWSIWTYIFFMIISQIGLWYWYSYNEYGKINKYNKTNNSNYRRYY